MNSEVYNINTKPNFTDQLRPVASTNYYLFYFGNEFLWCELSSANRQVDLFGKIFNWDSGVVYVDDYKIKTDFSFNDFVIKRSDELSVYMFDNPKTKQTLARSENASINIKGDSHITIRPIVEDKSGSLSYEIAIAAKDNSCYFNGQMIDNYQGEFAIGDQLVVEGIHIKRLSQQFKITDIKQELVFNRYKMEPVKISEEYPPDFPEYRRSPRIFKTNNETTVKITAPKELEELPKGALLKTTLPPLLMVGGSVATGIVSGGNLVMTLIMGSTAIATTTFSLSAYFANRNDILRQNKQRNKEYEKYLIEKQRELNVLESKERTASNHHFPKPEKLIEMIESYNSRIYEKIPANGDFLEISLGTCCLRPHYKIACEEFLERDELSIWAQDVIHEKSNLAGMPVPISLRHATIGLTGEVNVLKHAVQNLLLQLAAFQSYKDVEFITLISEQDYHEDFHSWRWLPHFKIQDLNLRGLVYGKRSREMVLNSFYQLIKKRQQALVDNKNQTINFSPHYVLTILADEHLSGHAINEYLATDMSKYGVTVVWCKADQSTLPETITTLVDYHNNHAGVLINKDLVNVNIQFTPYQLPKKETLENCIRRLANLIHVEAPKNALPNMVEFLDIYQVETVEKLRISKRWQQADTSKSLAVPLGLRGKDDIVYLDLHERSHGPHGLIAGTTGSGKSEIVQSYVLSLAINFSPEDVGFLPIDFKGGGMVNEFKNLPHLLGAITNLDGAASSRALASIKAELKNRQAQFLEFGVNHINGYTKLYKAGKKQTNESKSYPKLPLPHLFLISDEFAELKANEPEFMSELVSVARIGRSLGVHLILATQKPSGVVDEQIWSNSRFKLALKVADEADSNEIIKTPDAAQIVEPGRAYLQVGNNEIYELFQSAWSGPTYNPTQQETEQIDDRMWIINDLGQYELVSTSRDEEDDFVNREENMKESVTQLRAIVDHIATVVAADDKIVMPAKPWLPPLGSNLVAPDNKASSKVSNNHPNLAVAIGILDCPDEQSQKELIFDLAKHKHTAIYGSSGFGKSSTLQTMVITLARQNTPEHLQFNLFDFGTNGLLPLKDLPHTVDYVKAEEEAKVLKFLTMIKAEINRRKELFTQANVGSLSQYEAKTNQSLPVIVTVMDAYDSIKEQNELSSVVDELLMLILRDGDSVGMYVLLSGLRPNTFRMNLSTSITTKIALFLNDDNDLAEIVGRNRLVSEEIQGRIQIVMDDVRSGQIYLPVAGNDDFERLQNLGEVIDEMNQSWTGARPKSVPMLPDIIDFDWFNNHEDVLQWQENGNIALGFDADTTVVCGFKPKVDGSFLIVDQEPVQTESLRRTIINNLKVVKPYYQRIVFDFFGDFNEEFEAFDSIVTYGFDEFLHHLISGEESKSEKNKPSLIYIPDFKEFSQHAAISESVLVRLIRQGKEYGVHFIFQGEKRDLNDYDEVLKVLQTIKSGLVGSRMIDQNFVKVKQNYSEPLLEDDEHHYFSGRVIEKIKIVGSEY